MAYSFGNLLTVSRCCCRQCVVFEEDWGPCDEAPDPDDWDIITDTCEVIDPDPPNCQQQYLSVSPGGMIICKHVTAGYPQMLSAVVEPIAGTKPRLLLNVDYDPGTGTVGDYLYLEVDVDSNEFAYGRQSVGEIARFPATAATGTDLVAWVTGRDCNDAVSFSAGLDGLCHNDGWVCTQTPGGRYVGLANASSATANARFSGGDADTVLIKNHTDIVTGCTDCDCMCEDSCVPRTLHGVLTPAEGNDQCCIGSYEFDLEYDALDPQIKCNWTAIVDLGCGYHIALRLNKPTEVRSAPCETWSLEDAGGYPGVFPPGGSAPDVCTCCPLYMRWDFTAHYPDDATCSYRLEITE